MLNKDIVIDNDTGIATHTTTGESWDTFKVGNQLAYFHSKTDQEIGEAMSSFTQGEIQILTLASQGVDYKGIKNRLGIAQPTIRRSLNRSPLFKDCYYSLLKASRPISIEGIRGIAQTMALDSVQRIESLTHLAPRTVNKALQSGEIVTYQEEASAADKGIALKANVALLDMAGVTTAAPTTAINIGSIVIGVDARISKHLETWQD